MPYSSLLSVCSGVLRVLGLARASPSAMSPASNQSPEPKKGLNAPLRKCRFGGGSGNAAGGLSSRIRRGGFGEDSEDSARIRRGGFGEDSVRTRRTQREDSARRIRRGLGGLGEDSARRIRRGLGGLGDGRGLGEDLARTRRGFSEDSARTRRTRRGGGQDKK